LTSRRLAGPPTSISSNGTNIVLSAPIGLCDGEAGDGDPVGFVDNSVGLIGSTDNRFFPVPAE
jgi:hypothetical protein